MNIDSHITEAFRQVQKERAELHRLDTHAWLHDSLYTWQWWLLVALTIIPLILWWLVLDKKRAYEIAFYGCMITIMAMVLDDFGTNLLWWCYPIKLLPIAPPMFTADSILVPILLMLVYQRFSASWRSHWIANLIAAAILAFAAEPLFVWIGYYRLNEWQFVYSFLFYNASSSLAKLILTRIAR